MFFVALVALYYALETVHVSWKFGSVTDGLRISKVWALAAVPIGFGLIAFRLVQSFLRDFRDLINGRPVFEGNTLFE